MSKRALQAAILIGVCLIFVLVWAWRARPAETAAAAPAQEFTASREAADKSASVPAQIPAPRPAFIPTPSPRNNDVSAANRSIFGERPEEMGAPIPTPRSLIRLLLEPDERAAISGPAVRLTGGILRSTGGRRGLAYGRISMVNSTNSDIVDFRLESVIDGHTFALQPFEGSLDKPRAIGSRFVRAGERYTVPVIVLNYNGGRKPAIVPARIVLNAWLASGPGVAKDELLTP